MQDFLKFSLVFEFRQNMLPINLDSDKYQSGESCTFFIRSKQEFKPHDNT